MVGFLADNQHEKDSNKSGTHVSGTSQLNIELIFRTNAKTIHYPCSERNLHQNRLDFGSVFGTNQHLLLHPLIFIFQSSSNKNECAMKLKSFKALHRSPYFILNDKCQIWLNTVWKGEGEFLKFNFQQSRKMHLQISKSQSRHSNIMYLVTSIKQNIVPIPFQVGDEPMWKSKSF